SRAPLATLSGLKIADNRIVGSDIAVSLAFGANHAFIGDNNYHDSRLADVILFGDPPMPAGFVLDPTGSLTGPPPGADTTRANTVIAGDGMDALDRSSGTSRDLASQTASQQHDGFSVPAMPTSKSFGTPSQASTRSGARSSRLCTR